VALQWRKSAKKGFSGECCPSATPVPAGFQQSGRGKMGKNAGCDCRQIELFEFTQSWIVVMHCSRAGNVR
jgi:hypothetical protein